MKTHALAQYHPLVFLALGCMLSSSVIAWEWRALKSQRITTLSQPEPKALTLERFVNGQFRLLPLQEYREMVNMPLFFEGRAEVVMVTENVDDGAFKLTGVVFTPQGFVALIQDRQGAYYKLNEGADLNGWKVGTVEKDRVELVRNMESRELTLFASSNKRDLTAQDLEACFKHQADLPLEECFKHPDKYARKSLGATA
jgi:hypothetical protein